MGTNPSKEEPLKLNRENETPKDDGFEDLGRYQGNAKDGKRHGQGIYFFDNGDIYDGEWRKGRKEGFGTYQFSDGTKNAGWFYRDQYVGNEPNEKLKRKIRKKLLANEDNETVRNTDALQPQNTKTDDIDSDSENEENEAIPKLKDQTNLDLRRAESVRRQNYFRAKYNIPNKNNDPAQTTNDSRSLRDSIRAKWGVKRSKSYTAGAGQRRKDPRLVSQEEEQMEREKSRQHRETIRARYNLH